MKTLKFILPGMTFACLTVSCDEIASRKEDSYYIYITGEAGRTVNISYSQREQGKEYTKKNVTVQESVTLPFFKEVHTVQSIADPTTDSHLQVCSVNDATTKAIIFDGNLQLADGKCGIIAAFYPENAVNDCEYYKSITKDSIMNYLKSINYPCYMEFSKTDKCKKVQLYDWWHRNRK